MNIHTISFTEKRTNPLNLISITEPLAYDSCRRRRSEESFFSCVTRRTGQGRQGHELARDAFCTFEMSLSTALQYLEVSASTALATGRFCCAASKARNQTCDTRPLLRLTDRAGCVPSGLPERWRRRWHSGLRVQWCLRRTSLPGGTRWRTRMRRWMNPG